jgi:hypothetical protein
LLVCYKKHHILQTWLRKDAFLVLGVGLLPSILSRTCVLEVALVVIDGNDGSGSSHFSSTTNGTGGDDETIASILGGDALLNVTFNDGSTDDCAVTSLGYPGYSQNDFIYCEDNMSVIVAVSTFIFPHALLREGGHWPMGCGWSR